MSKQLLLLLLLITLGVATWEGGVLDGSAEEDGQVRKCDGIPLPR